jgi:hypothetical protein
MPVTVVGPTGPADVPAAVEPPEPDTSRFDSAIFAFPDLRGQHQDGGQHVDDRTASDRSGQDRDRTPAGRRASGPTTDQLASLSRRRGEREPSIDTASLPVTRAMSVVDDGDDDPFARRSPFERDTPAPVTRGRFPERLPEERAAEPEPEPEPEQQPPLKRPRGRSGTRSSSGAPRPMDESGPVEGVPQSRPRRGRTTMPSWDEIVFGKDED